MVKIPVRQYFALIARYLQPQRRRVVWMGLCLFASIGLQLFNPQVLAEFVDTVTGENARYPILSIALVYIAAAGGGQVLNVVTTYLASQVGWAATNALRSDLAEHILSLDLAFHKSHTPGELIERVDGDVSLLNRFFSQFTLLFGGNVLLMFGIVVAVSMENLFAGVAALLFALVALTVILRLRQVAVPYLAAHRQLSAEFYGFVGEHLTGREDVKANGARGWMLRRLLLHYQNWLLAFHRMRLAGTLVWGSSMAIFVFGNVIALAIGAWLYYRGDISLGTVFLLYSYFSQLSRPMEQIQEQVEQLQQADASIGRIRSLLDTQSALDNGGTAPVPAGAFDVEFSKVSFRYEDSEADPSGAWTIDELDIHLAAGETIGLLGRTGSGKSTLARLLLRLYDPQLGVIRFNGVDLQQMPVSDLRQRVGLVTQDVQIFQASVRENITFFDRSVSETVITDALQMLGLGDWLHSLPHGLDTRLGADGRGLSAGEAQLLAFARVFLKDPGLVILDEASSRLDPETEVLIERAVERLMHGRTGIIIAHRLATVQRVGTILIMEAGHVVEHGRLAALASDPGSRFAQLLKVGLEDVLV